MVVSNYQYLGSYVFQQWYIYFALTKGIVLSTLYTLFHMILLTTLSARIMLLILHMRKLRFREVQQLSQGHTELGM